MKKFSICMDYGHGGSDSGAIYMGRRESEDNLKLGKMITEKLRKAEILVDETRKGCEYLSLYNRTRYSNRKDYDYFISLHRNAFRPETASGVEVFIHPKGSKRAKILGGDILKELKSIGFRDRGLKKKSFYVLKHTKAPALLLEVGFIDNSLDNQLFDKKILEIAKKISQEIKNKAR